MRPTSVRSDVSASASWRRRSGWNERVEARSAPPIARRPSPRAYFRGQHSLRSQLPMSDTATVGALKRTPFHDLHAALGAKIVPFAGYEMPVQYPTGITAEHNAVRAGCGLFDVSHMGEFLVTGPQAVDFVDYVTTNDVAKLAVGQVHYSTILNDRGTIEDDCLVYRFADHLMMVVNASNASKDFAHISRVLDRFDARLEDVSDDTALLALQGPKAAEILAPLTDVDLA